jgi:MoxR-like ATPase
MTDLPSAATPPAAAPAPITGAALGELVAAVRDQVARAFVGQADVLDQILVALLAGGHVLVEGVPGLGKTLLVRALAQALDCSFARVQFTPDLMPSDVSGTRSTTRSPSRSASAAARSSPTCCWPTRSTVRRPRRRRRCWR